MEYFSPLVDDVLNTFDGFEIDCVLEVDQALFLI